MNITIINRPSTPNTIPRIIPRLEESITIVFVKNSMFFYTKQELNKWSAVVSEESECRESSQYGLIKLTR